MVYHIRLKHPGKGQMSQTTYQTINHEFENMAALQAACDEANRGFMSKIYQSRVYRVLSLLATPYYLPFEVGYQLVKNGSQLKHLLAVTMGVYFGMEAKHKRHRKPSTHRKRSTASNRPPVLCASLKSQILLTRWSPQKKHLMNLIETLALIQIIIVTTDFTDKTESIESTIQWNNTESLT